MICYCLLYNCRTITISKINSYTREEKAAKTKEIVILEDTLPDEADVKEEAPEETTVKAEKSNTEKKEAVIEPPVEAKKTELVKPQVEVKKDKLPETKPAQKKTVVYSDNKLITI